MKIDIVPFVLYSNYKINAPSRLARARRVSFFRAARRDCLHLYNYCDKRGNLPMIKQILKSFTCILLPLYRKHHRTDSSVVFYSALFYYFIYNFN